LSAVLFIGGHHAQLERMPKHIDRQMDLTVFPAFGWYRHSRRAYRSRASIARFCYQRLRLLSFLCAPPFGDTQHGAQEFSHFTNNSKM
jgi:hypothetical protein